MSSELKLKPCPFCGAKAEVISRFGQDVYRVECTECSAVMGSRNKEVFGSGKQLYFDSEEKAITAWNKRGYEYGN